MGAQGETDGGGSGRRTYYCTMEYPLGFEKPTWNKIWLGTTHFFGLQGLYFLISGYYTAWIFIPSFFIAYFAGAGITVGCHRYWAHRTYKAKLPLQILLAIAQTMGVQYPIFKWCRDHRLHHKFTETDADPHDARRGFYFSHMGWLFEPEHPAVKEKEATIDLSDLDNDPVVRFQTKYYWYLLPIFNYLVPISILHYCVPALTLYELTCANYAWYVLFLHGTWLVNSAAHMYGYRPYDNGIHATENPLVSLVTVGEGWHNYHHTFPWDYKTAELGTYGANWSALFIDMFAWMGLAYDLKTVPHEVVMARVKRTGNMEVHQEMSHTHRTFHNFDKVFDNVRGKGDEGEKEKLPAWGWGDEDIPQEHFQITQRINRPSKKA